MKTKTLLVVSVTLLIGVALGVMGSRCFTRINANAVESGDADQGRSNVQQQTRGDGLKLGYYSSGSEGFDALDEIIRGADRTLYYDKNRSFSFGTNKITYESGNGMEFKFDQIDWFLEGEKHKDLIVIYFDLTVMWNEDEFVKERAAEVLEQMNPLGYKRVIIIGLHAFGHIYVADTFLDNNKPNKAEMATPRKPSD